MAYLILVNTLLLICAFGEGYTLDEDTTLVDKQELSSGILPYSPEHAERLRLRRAAAPPRKKKPSLFDRIMSRVTNIRDSHPSHKRLTNTRRTPSRTSYRRPHSHRRPTYRRPTYRRPTSRYRRPTYRRPKVTVPSTSNVPKKKLSLFDKIMGRVTQIRDDHSSHRKPVHQRTRKPTYNRRPPVERKPVERTPGSKWSNKAKPIEVSPVRPSTPVNKWSNKAKPIEISPVVSSRSTNGLTISSALHQLQHVYKGDDKKIMKVVSWNVFEGKTSRSYLSSGRREICSQLTKMKPTVFGLQGATNEQISRIRMCLPRSPVYSYFRGSGRYNWDIRKYLYSPIFYVRSKDIKIKAGSGTLALRNKKRRLISLGTHIKITFSTKGDQPTQRNKRNNIKQLWKRLNHVYNNPHKTSTSSSKAGAETEVLIVNSNLLDVQPTEIKQQLEYMTQQIGRLSQHGTLPVILMGDLKTKATSSLYRTLFQRHIYSDTLDKRINRNAYPMARRDTSNPIIDYILESKLNTIFAARITDSLRTRYYKPSKQKPLFAVFEMP